MFHTEELRALQLANDPYLRIIGLAKRYVLYFQSFEQYDLDLILGNFFMMLTEHDAILALKDGLWLPGMKKLPQSLQDKRIPVRKPYYRRLCHTAWTQTGERIMKHPASALTPEPTPPVTLAPKGQQAILRSLPSPVKSARVRPPRPGYVYLAQAIGTSRVKIGFTQRLDVRLEGLRTASPFPLTVLRTIAHPDAFALEHQLHRRYAAYRQHGEWFDLPPAVLDALLTEDFT